MKEDLKTKVGSYEDSGLSVPFCCYNYWLYLKSLTQLGPVKSIGKKVICVIQE